mmetsp:Transcript_116293/g.237883  ORF Transcript_116293/g.237883 Transcript_116293/m.237883 type:complete len:258 (-) Transcript_116293:1952-2725(-)
MVFACVVLVCAFSPSSVLCGWNQGWCHVPVTGWQPMDRCVHACAVSCCGKRDRTRLWPAVYLDLRWVAVAMDSRRGEEQNKTNPTGGPALVDSRDARNEGGFGSQNDRWLQNKNCTSVYGCLPMGCVTSIQLVLIGESCICSRRGNQKFETNGPVDRFVVFFASMRCRSSLPPRLILGAAAPHRVVFYSNPLCRMRASGLGSRPRNFWKTSEGETPPPRLRTVSRNFRPTSRTLSSLSRPTSSKAPKASADITSAHL